VVRMFWQHEFRSWNDRYRTEALSDRKWHRGRHVPGAAAVEARRGDG